MAKHPAFEELHSAGWESGQWNEAWQRHDGALHVLCMDVVRERQGFKQALGWS